MGLIRLSWRTAQFWKTVDLMRSFEFLRKKAFQKLGVNSALDVKSFILTEF